MDIRRYTDLDYPVFKTMLGECFSGDYEIPLTEKQLDELCREVTASANAYITYLDLLVLNSTAIGFVIFQIDSQKSDWCEKEGKNSHSKNYVIL